MTTGNTTVSDAELRLLAFMGAMHQWETALIEAHKSSGGTYFDANKDALRASLLEIYRVHLTAKERKNGRVAALNFGTPLEYDPGLERITSCEVTTPNKKVVIETARAGAATAPPPAPRRAARARSGTRCAPRDRGH
jgi:hypothetical protein